MGMTRTEHRLLKKISRASIDFKLIEPGDRIMVAVSGGKDSYGMLQLLRLLKRKVPFDFELIAVNLDQGHPGFPGHLLEGWLKREGYATYHRTPSQRHHGQAYERWCAQASSCAVVVPLLSAAFFGAEDCRY